MHYSILHTKHPATTAVRRLLLDDRNLQGIWKICVAKKFALVVPLVAEVSINILQQLKSSALIALAIRFYTS